MPISKAGALFVLNQVNVGENAAARYRPTLRKKRDYATTEIFVCLDRASLIAESVGEQCEGNFRPPRSVTGPRKPLSSSFIGREKVTLKQARFGAADAIAECHLAISLAGIEALSQDTGTPHWSVANCNCAILPDVGDPRITCTRVFHRNFRGVTHCQGRWPGGVSH